MTDDFVNYATIRNTATAELKRMLAEDAMPAAVYDAAKAELDKRSLAMKKIVHAVVRDKLGNDLANHSAYADSLPNAFAEAITWGAGALTAAARTDVHVRYTAIDNLDAHEILANAFSQRFGEPLVASAEWVNPLYAAVRDSIDSEMARDDVTNEQVRKEEIDRTVAVMGLVAYGERALIDTRKPAE